MDSKIYTKEFANKVIIVDPNKLDAGNGEYENRYINHEDLVMYAKMEVFSTPKSAILDTGENIQQTKLATMQYVNFLNPTEGENQVRGQFTTEWTEMFDPDRKYDTESFGITSIDIEYNADFIPTVHVTFTDIRGKTLFERGDDPNNPYNIFFQFPYPEFKLTIKGYYGRAITLPLILEKTNTSFDASTGDYITNCVFRSFTFAILNDISLKNAIAAPFMYQGKNEKGLTTLVKILHSYYNEPKIGVDLAGFRGRPYTSGTDEANAKDAQDRAKRYPITIPGLLKRLKDLEKGITQTTTITNRLNDIQTIERISLIMDSVDDELISIYVNNGMTEVGTNYKTNSFTVVTTVENDMKNFIVPKFQTNIHTKNPEIQRVIDDILFFFEQQFVSLTMTEINGEFFFDRVIVRDNTINFKKQLSNINLDINDELIATISSEAEKQLGFKPTVRNINLIILANIETYLKLLSDTGIAAKKVITDAQSKRINNIYQQSIINLNDGGQVIFPWPDFFTKGNNRVSIRTYPGLDKFNYNDFEVWPEIEFIEQLILAVEKINDAIQGFTTEVVTTEPFYFSPVSTDDIPILTDNGLNIGEFPNRYTNVNDTYLVNTNMDDIQSTILVRMIQSCVYLGLPFNYSSDKNIRDLRLTTVATELGEADGTNLYNRNKSSHTILNGILQTFTDNQQTLDQPYYDNIFSGTTFNEIKSVITENFENKYFGATCYKEYGNNPSFLINQPKIWSIGNKEYYGRNGQLATFIPGYNSAVISFVENDILTSNTKAIKGTQGGFSINAKNELQAFNKMFNTSDALTNFNKSTEFHKLYIGSVVSDGGAGREQYQSVKFLHKTNTQKTLDISNYKKILNGN